MSRFSNINIYLEWLTIKSSLTIEAGSYSDETYLINITPWQWCFRCQLFRANNSKTVKKKTFNVYINTLYWSWRLFVGRSLSDHGFWFPRRHSVWIESWAQLSRRTIDGLNRSAVSNYSILEIQLSFRSSRRKARNKKHHGADKARRNDVSE